MPAAEAHSLAQAILEVKERVTLCSVCQNVTEIRPLPHLLQRLGATAASSAWSRSRWTSCRSSAPARYQGQYHVLHGAISPMDGIGPEDLKIAELLGRLRSGEVTEVILATNPNLEGEATSMYLSRLLSPLGVRVTRLARGLPVGGDLEYADDVTLARALEGRQEMDALMPLSARLYKTEAIILRQRKLGEADRILTLYTPALGKLDAKAKGVRKTTSRLSGHLQPLNRVVVQLAQGHAADVITGVETLDSFRHLREDLDLLSRGLYVAELTDRITPEHVHSFPTYRLLLDTLRRLDKGGDARHRAALLRDAAARPVRLPAGAGALRRLPAGAGAGATTSSRRWPAAQSAGPACRGWRARACSP